MLEGKVCVLSAQGMGKNPKKYAALKKSVENTLWECGQLGEKVLKSILSSGGCLDYFLDCEEN